MEMQVIGFVPPVEGVEGNFNTFRLGGTLAKALVEGQEVLLMDMKRHVVFGRAKVTEVYVGPLREMCAKHAFMNHRELARADDADAADRLFAYLQKLFGPHIATDNKRTSVVYLKRIE